MSSNRVQKAQKAALLAKEAKQKAEEAAVIADELAAEIAYQHECELKLEKENPTLWEQFKKWFS